MNALEKAGEMMETPQNELPPLAMEYFDFLQQSVGACMEVYFTAFAAYCQMVEGLECDDENYTVTHQIDLDWWAAKGFIKK